MAWAPRPRNAAPATTAGGASKGANLGVRHEVEARLRRKREEGRVGESEPLEVEQIEAGFGEWFNMWEVGG